MIRFKQFLLLESSLSPAELKKDPNKVILSFHPNVKDRGEVLLIKIEKKEPIQLVSGKKVLIISNEDLLDILKSREYDKLKGNIFKDGEGKSYKLSDFEKTEEFGSSGGVGGGAKATAIFESATAVLAAVFVGEGYINGQEAFNILSELEQDEMVKLLNKYSSKFDVSNPIKEIADFLINNQDWLLGISYTAEAIKKELKANKNHIFHRDSKKVDEIIKHAMGQVRDLGYKIMKDKWNPADIWMFDSSYKGYSEFMKTEALADANNVLLKSLKQKHDIDGISLKKVGNAYPTIAYINVSEEPHDEITIDDIKVKIRGKVPLSKDIEILDTDDGIKFQIRDFFATIGKPVVGELIGKMARAGKIGANPMFTWMKNELNKKIKVYDKKDIMDKKGMILDSFLNDFYKIIKILQKRKNIVIDKPKLNDLKTKDDIQALFDELYVHTHGNELDIMRVLSSKIQALQFAAYSTDEFLKFSYSYAKSNIEGVSGPFIKIGN